MKNRIVRCLILCCLVLPWAGGALAQETISYEDLAQELRQVVEERIALEQRLLAYRAQSLTEKGKAIYRTVAGVMPPGLDSPEAIKAEIGALRETQTRLEKLVQYAVEQQRWTRAVALQLRGYADEFRRIEQVNRIKTGLSMAMTTILEVAPIASTTKPAEIAAWAAEKLANETIKRTLDGSSDYYVRQLTGISQKAGFTTEALRRLWNVAEESLPGIQLYLKENEGKDISDPTALVLSRGRIIKDHLVRAEDSLIEFHRFFELQVLDGQNRLADIEALIGQLDKLTEDAQVSEKKAGDGDDRQDDRTMTETDLMRSIEELRRRETDIVNRLNRASHEGGQVAGKEAQALFSEFLTLDAAFFGRQGGYAAQAESIRDLLGRIAQLEAEAQKLEPALEQELQKILQEFVDKPKYDLSIGDGNFEVPDRVALDNLADFKREYYKQMDDRLQRRGALIADLGQAQLDLPEQWYRQPYDYLSYQTESAKYHRAYEVLWPAVRAIAQAMAARYEAARKGAIAYPEGTPIEFGGTTYVVLSEDAGRLYRLIEQLTDAGQRHARMPASPFGGLEQAGAPVSTVVLDGLQRQQNRDSYNEESIGITAEKAHSQERARSFRAAAGLYLADVSRVEQNFAAYDAADSTLQSSLDGLVGQGILTRQESAGMVSYVLRGDAMLGDQPADCRGVGKALQAIGQGGEGLAGKHRAAEQAWQATLRGTGGMPASPWSALNEPGMHEQLQAAEQRTQAARDRLVAPVRLPDLSLPLGGVVMRERFPKLWQGLQASLRDIDLSVTVAGGEIRAASEMDAVDGAWLAAVKARPEQIEEDFDARLGCMAADSTLIASLRGKINQLKTLRDSIGSKPEIARRAPVDDPAGGTDGGWTEDGGNATPGATQVQAFYQSFVDAYGRGDTRGLLALLAPDWQGGDGADLRDVEALLENSFRVFERIQYRISGFSVRPAAGRVVVSYRVKIVGEHLRLRLHHEEESDIVEEVGLIGGQPRILRTLSGSQWLR